MQADLHSDHTTVTYGRFNAGELADSLTETVFNPIYARRIGHFSHRCADIAQLRLFLLVTVALLSLCDLLQLL